MASLVHATAHGLSAGDPFYFANFSPTDAGVDGSVVYYVLAAGLTADAFEFSTAAGGTPFVLTNAITSASLVHLDVYTQVADGTMDAPTAPAAPGSVTLSSAVVVAPDGTAITRLDIAVVQPTTATLRHTIVTVTGGSNTAKVVIPVGQTTGSIASVVPGTAYTGTGIAYDTFGLASSATVSAAHTAAGDVTAPAVPTGLTGSAGILGNIVSWAANTEADLSHYELAVATDGVTFSVVRIGKSAVVSITGLTAGTTYTYKVRAVDLTGNASAYTSTVTAVPRQVTGSGLSGTDIKALSIDGADIKAAAITAAKITAGTITSNEIAALTIVAANIAASTITGSKIAAATIAAANIIAGTITANEIAAATIVAANIAAGTITGANIAAGTITASNLVAGTITANEIAAGTITAAKIAAGTITSNEIAALAITVGKLAQNANNEAANGGLEQLSPAAPAVDTFAAVSVSPFLGWSTGDTVARIAYTKTNVHGGGIAALIKANSAALARFKTEQVPVIGGRRYHFSYWYRGAAGNNSGATVQAFVREYDINGVQGFTTSFVNHAVGTTTTWANETGTCVLDASTVAVDILIRNGGVASGDVVGADDIELYPADYDMSHAGGNVVIDSNGLTINNGALTLQDEFGKTVQTSSGFSGNWADFIQTGLYNGRFLQGAAGVVTSGRTSKLPNWTLADTTGSPVATFVANGGVAVTFAALSNKKSFTSDAISVHPAAIYQSSFMVSINKAGGTLFLILAPFIDWFQADGTASAITATTTLDTSSFSATLGATAINNLLPVRPPSDARFAKLRFTVEENAIGTHTVGNSLTLLSASLKEVGNTTTGRGAAFPTSPATNDHFYRTDLQYEFYFDGTRWLTTQMFQAGSGIEANTGTYTISFAATAARTMMANCVPPNVATDVWVDSITMGVEIASGGTALDASNKWVMTFMKGTALTPTTSIGSITINSGASAAWRATSVAIGALLGLANPVVSLDLTKTGTPGAFQLMSPFIVFYRIVTT